jgi:outer membrane lipoprotein-sorting protein
LLSCESINKEMMKTFHIGLLVMAACWLALSGCRPAVPKPVALPPVAEKVLLQQLVATRNSFRSLRGLAKVHAEIEGKTSSARQVVLLEKPDRLRTEILGPFGQPVLRVTVIRKHLSVHIPGEKLFLQGPATADNLARFTLLPLGVEELVQLALYDVPLIPYVESILTIEGDRYALRLVDSRGDSQILRFDGKIRLAGVEYYRRDDLLLRVTYDRFNEQQDAFPGSVALFMPKRQASLTMIYSDLEINGVIPEERFHLEPPPGTRVQQLP